MTIQLPEAPDRDKIRSLSKIMLTAFVLVAAALFFWSVVRSISILAREDNPRLVEAELRIQRGTIVDRNMKILAQNIGRPDLQQRFYPFPEIGPAVGYYSLKYGTAGAENGFDPILSGEDEIFSDRMLRQALHMPQKGVDVQLALEADLQEKTRILFENRDGAVLLLEMPHDDQVSARIQVLVSNPGYDANLLEEQFDELAANDRAPLLNRVTQGQYQPGLLLQPLILAYALDQGVIQLSDTISDPQRQVAVNGTMTQCASQPPQSATWADVLLHICPAPMQDLADQLGLGGLDAAFAAFALYQDPILEIDTETVPDEPLADPLRAGIGQDNLTITPLKLGLAIAALAGQGYIPSPQLALATSDEEGSWQEWTADKKLSTAISLVTARSIKHILPQHNGIREFSPLVISGPEGSTNAWYIGISETDTADYVVIVVLEGSDEVSSAQKIGRSIIPYSK